VQQQDVDYKATRSKQFNMFVEKQIGGNVVSAGYVGSRTDRFPLNQNIKLPPVGPGSVQTRRPWYSQYPGLTNINMVRNIGEKTYDAAQVMFQRRYTDGLNFNTHYTLANARQSTLAPWDTSILEWGNVPIYDIRHHWVGIVGYVLPWGQGLTGISRGLATGWQINLVANYASGGAFTIVNSAAQTNTGGADRPNQIGDPDLPASERTLNRWFNTAAFARQPQYTAGNVGLGTMYGPAQRRLDLSFIKNLRLAGARNIQARLEIYNITNTPSFQPPDPNFGSTTFGSISSTGNAIARQMQFALKYLF